MIVPVPILYSGAIAKGNRHGHLLTVGNWLFARWCPQRARRALHLMNTTERAALEWRGFSDTLRRMISGLPKPKRTALQGKLSSWNEAKGFGWVEAGGKRWFAHIKEFAAGQRRPESGDAVIFFAGMDEQGRPRAMEVRLARQKARIKVMTWLVLGGLLVLPVMAGFRLPFAPWGLPAVMSAFSLLAWVAYANDKVKARQGAWRTEESTLHWIALFGGWPGAFLAQRCYRHKTAKLSFQLIFWMIVLIHQFLAADVLLGHEPSGKLWRTIQTIRQEVAEIRTSP